MKRNYIIGLGLVIILIIGGVYILLDKDDDTKNLPSITEGNPDDIDTGTNINMDDIESTLTVDEGCVQDLNYYIEPDDIEEGFENNLGSLMLEMKTLKCRSILIGEDIYSIGISYMQIEELDSGGSTTSTILDTTPIYAYSYVYSEDVDFNTQAYVLLKSGEKIYPSDLSVINSNEAYLIFEVTQGLGDIEKIIIETDAGEINLMDVDAFGCSSGNCAY